jgi:putative addiction module antidote
MTTVQLTTIGDSTGVVLPQDVLARLKVGKGDLVQLVETPGGVELMKYDPVAAAQLEVASQVMREDQKVLGKLAE